MLEFSKSVLQKVSFDHLLFKKELTKSIQWINQTDLEHLKEWCLEMYGAKYANIIHQAFETIL
jgi:hypothetical protein|tara:strand:- start:490 stop:678 length:189 start_codon:yes stop_codon:yes gene_type:complete